MLDPANQVLLGRGGIRRDEYGVVSGNGAGNARPVTTIQRHADPLGSADGGVNDEQVRPRWRRCAQQFRDAGNVVLARRAGGWQLVSLRCLDGADLPQVAAHA